MSPFTDLNKHQILTTLHFSAEYLEILKNVFLLACGKHLHTKYMFIKFNTLQRWELHIWKAKVNFIYLYLLFKHDETNFSYKYYLLEHFPST